MMRSASERRANDNKFISKRVRIILDNWGWRGKNWINEFLFIKEPHRLHKYNLQCGCYMCRDKKYNRAQAKEANRRELEEVCG